MPESRESAGAGSLWAERAEKVREPSLIDAVVSVRAPAMSICARDGQIRRFDGEHFRTAHGYYVQDRRVLSLSELTVNGIVPEYLGHRLIGASESKHVCTVRTREDPTPDPVLVVERIHRAEQGESITIANHGVGPRTLVVALRLSADLADVSEVRRGQPSVMDDLAEVGSCKVRWTAPDDGTSADVDVTPPAEDVEVDGSDVVLSWHVVIAEGKVWHLETKVSTAEGADSIGQVLSKATRSREWAPLASLGDRHLDELARQGLADLDALLLAPSGKPRDVFAAAGAPWYLTLFGRDSLWAARLLLPIDSGGELAYGTLRALAGDRQGQRNNRGTDEQPGKILHELRRRTTVHQQGEVLPPVYYGSMDATPLFVVLLTEVFQAGWESSGQDRLLDAARRALRWMRDRTDNDDFARGFIRYTTSAQGALFNHGWKDSRDAVVEFDGRSVRGPIALAEVQAYAYQAATGFADLIERRDLDKAREEADELRDWAERLKRRFLEQFVVTGGPGDPYFAMALDGNSKRVLGLTSNMGHLLGTGLLDSEQSAWIARHLMSKELDSGWGLRTRGADHPRFNPFSYHGGAVWAHDTAIAIRGLSLAAHDALAEGGRDSDKNAEYCVQAARELARGLVAAGQAFNYRLPELFSGGAREDGDISPLPFPSACRPQAWSAAAGVAVHTALARIRDL